MELYDQIEDYRDLETTEENDDFNQEEKELGEELEDALDTAAFEEDSKNDKSLQSRFTQQELIRLVADFHSKDPEIAELAKTVVIKQFDGLVNWVITHSYQTYYQKHYDDMLNQGRIGVLIGFDHYTVSLDGKFYQPSTLLVRYIKGEIKKLIAEVADGTSARYQTVGYKMMAIIRRKKAKGETISPDDIATELDIPIMTAKQAFASIQAKKSLISLDQDVYDKEGSTIGDTIISKTFMTPEETVLKKEAQESLYDAIDKSCTSLEGAVIALAYGLDGGKERSQAQIAETLNIPKEKVRKFLASAQIKLRHYLIQKNGYRDLVNEHTRKSSLTGNRRTSEDLRRELDSMDWSSIGEVSLE